MKGRCKVISIRSRPFLSTSFPVNEEWAGKLQGTLAKYQAAKMNNMLLMVEFVTVRDYLFLLREISKILSIMGKRAMLYLAAAVSDFYIPEAKMVIL